jgi:hypothetical protein
VGKTTAGQPGCRCLPAGATCSRAGQAAAVQGLRPWKRSAITRRSAVALQPQSARPETICLKCLEKAQPAVQTRLPRRLVPISADRPVLPAWVLPAAPVNAAPHLLWPGPGCRGSRVGSGLAVSQAPDHRQEQKLTKSALQGRNPGFGPTNSQQLATSRANWSMGAGRTLPPAGRTDVREFGLERTGADGAGDVTRGCRGTTQLHRRARPPPTSTTVGRTSPPHSKLPFHLGPGARRRGRPWLSVRGRFTDRGRPALRGAGRRLGEPLEPLPHGGEIKAVAFSSDGSIIATLVPIRRPASGMRQARRSAIAHAEHWVCVA